MNVLIFPFLPPSPGCDYGFFLSYLIWLPFSLKECGKNSPLKFSWVLSHSLFLPFRGDGFSPFSPFLREESFFLFPRYGGMVEFPLPLFFFSPFQKKKRSPFFAIPTFFCGWRGDGSFFFFSLHLRMRYEDLFFCSCLSLLLREKLGVLFLPHFFFSLEVFLARNFSPSFFPSFLRD